MTPTATPVPAPTTEWLRAQLARGESLLCEFKRQWHDLKLGDDKGEFVKDVLALANTATPAEPGFLVFGVEEGPTGASVVSLASAPEPEAVSQILAAYTQPPVDVRYGWVDEGPHRVAVLTVVASDARPHWVVRDVGKLKRESVFLRHGTVVGQATMPEIETMIRQKNARLGPLTPAAEEPIRAGFVAVPGMWDQRLIVRLANLTTEPVSGVSAVLDVRLPAFPELFVRRQVLTPTTMYAAEAREAQVDLSQEVFPGAPRLSPSDLRRKWMDLVLTVQYRDRHGFVRQLQQALTVGG
jgi:hypothetical protein